MKHKRVRWVKVYFKVGTLPGLHYFLPEGDQENLKLGGYVQLRPDDGRTKPEFQHIHSVLIDEIRILNNGQTMYLAARF